MASSPGEKEGTRITLFGPVQTVQGYMCKMSLDSVGYESIFARTTAVPVSEVIVCVCVCVCVYVYVCKRTNRSA